jgi:hypothetical protein
MPFDLHAIRELAYRIWEQRGRPEGQADEDWFEAERRLSSGGAPPIKVPNPPEDEITRVPREPPKVGSRDAPGG